MFLWLPVHFPVLSPPSQPWRALILERIPGEGWRACNLSPTLSIISHLFFSAFHHQASATYNQDMVVSLSLSFQHPCFQVGPFELQIEPSVLPENTFSHFRFPPPYTRFPWAVGQPVPLIHGHSEFPLFDSKSVVGHFVI